VTARFPGLLLALSLCAFPHATQPVLAQDADVPVPQTYGDAMRWYRDAAEAGDAKAMFYLGLTMEQGLRAGADAREAVAWYRRSADGGFALAQFKLGQLYQFGQLVEQDADRARRWYAEAAAQNLADAQYNLAVMLETGEGGPVDGERAQALYRDAAAGGIPEAFVNLAGLLAQGDLVEQDLVEALKWLLLAERAGVEQGQAMAAAVRQLLNPVEVADAEARADRWASTRGVGRPLPRAVE
jgi:TPR repeat protein